MREKTYQIYLELKSELERMPRPDALLPSERILCERFNVGRSSIRTALQQLELDGLLRCDHTRGVRQVARRTGLLHKVYIVQSCEELFRMSPEQLGVLSGASSEIYACGGETVPIFGNYTKILEELMKNYNTDEHSGVIFLENAAGTWYEKLCSRNIPAIIANFEDNRPGVVSSRMNFRQIGRRAGQEFLKRGYRHIAIIGRSAGYVNDELAAGLRGALAEEKIWFDEKMIIPDLFYTRDREYKQKIVNSIIDLLRSPEPPDAFLVFRIPRVRKLLQALEQCNMNIPGEPGIIAYDTPGWFDEFDIDISTLTEPVEELGKRAVEMLREWNKNKSKPQDELLTAGFIATESLRNPPGQ